MKRVNDIRELRAEHAKMDRVMGQDTAFLAKAALYTAEQATELRISVEALVEALSEATRTKGATARNRRHLRKVVGL